ncbi:MAG: ATP-binding cassette domain-containing protein [Candidatus Acidiferrales bacterium]
MKSGTQIATSESIDREIRSPLVRIERLKKSYVQRRPISRAKFEVTALQDASLTIDRGTTFALIGESGSGKSTLARCLALLEKPAEGEIRFEGRNILGLAPPELFAARSQIQMIFQDPASALNPAMTALEIVAEPLEIQKRCSRADRRDLALGWVARVGLPSGSEHKRPMEFSGGQRQRLAIARALVLAPKLLILDEALSSLDLANQEMILKLLADLQREHSLTYLHISHDLRQVAHFVDEIAVMHEGRVVEQQPAAKLFAEPRDAYTRELLVAMPSLESIVLDRLT